MGILIVIDYFEVIEWLKMVVMGMFFKVLVLSMFLLVFVICVIKVGVFFCLRKWFLLCE